MSDSDESGVTYTDVSSPFEESPDIGSPKADDHEHLELPEMLEDPYIEVALQAPPSPDYILSPEDPEQAPPSPDYVPGPEHADDEIVAEEQPYAEDASPTAQSPEYVPESDLEAHPEDDDDEDPEENPVDYPVDGGDDARISIPAPVPVPAWSDLEVVRLLAMSSSPSSPLSPWSLPPPQIPFPPLPPILSPPSPVHREDRPEVTLPPWKRLGIALGPGYEGAPVSTDTELGGYMREFETRVRRDTDEIFMRLDDEQSERQLLACRLNMLFRDRRTHAYIRHLMETEARLSREAWVRSTYTSDLVRGEVMSLRTTVLGQMTKIRELHAADRMRQFMILEMLRADHRRSTEIIELRTTLQGQVTALQGQVIALQAHVTALQGQQGPARGPTQLELPEEAGSSS
nr:hypothetical protein [Tanacetum cinerariifolium]